MTTWELFLIIDKFYVIRLLFVLFFIAFIYEAIENKWDRREIRRKKGGRK